MNGGLPGAGLGAGAGTEVTLPPLALGYIRARQAMTDTELNELRDQIIASARDHGYRLGTVFVEQDDAESTAFNALYDSIWRQNAQAVLIPSLDHFALRDSPDEMRRTLEAEACVEVIIAAPTAPSPAGGT